LPPISNVRIVDCVFDGVENPDVLQNVWAILDSRTPATASSHTTKAA
jgi:hypothetical protein